MKALTQLQQNRLVVEDFTLTTLEGLPGFLRPLGIPGFSARSFHGTLRTAGLAVRYPGEAIQQALEMCHEQILRGFWNRL